MCYLCIEKETKVMVKFEIKNTWNGLAIFEHEKENNTLKDTVIEALKNGVNLSCADLRRADLSGVDLRGAVLRDAYLQDAYLSCADLRRADLSGANLSCADLRRADLSGANLNNAYFYGANLRGADLHKANLRFANIREANLRRADLYGADLYGADLYGADLYGADLHDADLSGVSLRSANLREANFRYAKNVHHIPLACPSEGAFIGWKKVHGHLVKLEIPEDARRCSATTNKCRCDKAKVLSITDLDGENPITEIENTAQRHHVVYKVGKMVYPDSFDEDRWNECSNGIHFFVNKQDAIDY